MRVQSAGGGRVVIEATAGAAHLNAEGSGVVHGGIVATLLDAAATFALIALDGDDWSTVDLRIDYLRPVPAGPLRVSGEVVHAGRRFGRASAALCYGAVADWTAPGRRAPSPARRRAGLPVRARRSGTSDGHDRPPRLRMH